jgi:hypothetical protein
MVLKNPVLHIPGYGDNSIDMRYRSLVKPTVKKNPAPEKLPGEKILS